MVTLLMACGFMGIWIRGAVIYDVVKFGTGHQQHVLMVIDSIVIYESWESSGIRPQWDWKTTVSDRRSLTRMKISRIGGIVTDHDPFHFHISASIVAIPLTLFAAFLLLSKPHQSTSTKTPEPIAREGG